MNWVIRIRQNLIKVLDAYFWQVDEVMRLKSTKKFYEIGPWSET